jgi:hypothetical protein
MKTKILARLRKEAKEEVYLSPSYTEDGKLCIIYKIHDAPFGLTATFYNPEFDIFEQDEVTHYNTVEEALPDLARARRYYILYILHTDYRTFSKGNQKRKEIERVKQENYRKYLQQF